MWHIALRDMPACRKVTASSHLLRHCHIPPLTPAMSLPHPTPTPRARARLPAGPSSCLTLPAFVSRRAGTNPEPLPAGTSPTLAGVSGPGGLRSPIRVPVSTHALQGPGVSLPRTTRHPPNVCPGGAVWCAGYLPRVTCISRYFHATSVRPTGEVVSPSSAERSPPICHLIGCALPVTNFAASAI